MRGLKMKRMILNAGNFFRVLRKCLSEAWRDTDCNYHIPKSRYQDTEYNRSAYRSSAGPGFWSWSWRSLLTLIHCISVSWEASDTFYHLPKSRYQDADFIRDLMKLAPGPRGKLLYRPFTIGMGVVGEADGKGWTVKSWEDAAEDLFVAPEDMIDPGSKPELEM